MKYCHTAFHILYNVRAISVIIKPCIMMMALVINSAWRMQRNEKKIQNAFDAIYVVFEKMLKSQYVSTSI